MTVEAKLKVTLQDTASKGLSQLEQKIKQIQQRILDDTKKLNQDSANADKQSNEKKKKGWSELEAHVKQIQQRIADAAKKAAQDATDAERRAKEQKKKGWSELEAHVKRIQQQMADDAKRKAQQEAEADRAAKEKRKRGWSELEAHAKRIQQSIVDAAKKAAQDEANAAKRALKEIEDARKTLGTRSHAQITEQMNHTRQAYQTLARSGVSSWREQAQAADAMRRKVTELTNEMGRLTTAQKGMNALRFGASATAGLIGGVAGTAYAMKEPIKNALDFDKRIAYLTNTAFPERDLQGKKIGAKQLEQVIHQTVDKTGIDLSGATNLLDVMISGGVMTRDQSIRALPFLAKTAVANNAEPQDVGRFTNVLYGTGTVTNQTQLERAHNMAIAAGQAGGFEYKNQVMYLPGQVSAAKSAGMVGLGGLRDVLTMNETSMLATGTADQAGVATHNWLIKAASKDTARDYENYMEDHYKRKGASLHTDLMKARAKGVGAMKFWQLFFEKEIDADQKLKAYKKKLDKAKSPAEAKEALSAIELIGKGSIISSLFQEMRGQSAILGYQNAPYRKKVEAQVDSAVSGRFQPNEQNYQFIAQTNAIKTQRVGNLYEEKQKHLLDSVTTKLGNAADKTVALAKKYPAISDKAPIVPWAASGIGGAIGGAWAMKTFMPGTYSSLAGAGSSLTANLTVALSRFSGILSGVASRAPILARAGLQYAAPYAPLIARVAAVPAVGYTAYQAGGLLNRATGNVASDALSHGMTNVKSAFDSIVSKLMNEKDGLSSAVSNLMHWKPDPVKVDTQTHVTVALAPGLVPVAQSSKSTSTGTGANTTSATVGGKGNLWTGAPR